MNIRRIICFSMALALALAGGAPAAQAKPAKQAVSRGSGSHIAGNNIYGRAGLLFTDTAEAPAPGEAAVTGHLLFGLGDDVDAIDLPVGFHYGLARNFEVSGSLNYTSLDFDVPNVPGVRIDDSRNGLNMLTLGGKYVVPRPGNAPIDLAFGLDLAFGPLSSDLGGDGVDVNLKGIVTHTLMPQKLFLNGGLGILVVDDRDVEARAVNPVTGAVTTVKVRNDGDTVLQLNGGVGYMLTPRLMGIGELGINQLGEDSGVLSVGLRGRASGDLTWQALLGLGLNDNPSDIILGGGLTHRFSL